AAAAVVVALQVLTFRTPRRAPALPGRRLWRRLTLEGPSAAPRRSRRPGSGGHEARPRSPALSSPAAAAMSRGPEEVNRLTESTYRNVMEQFNPGLRNLINLGKNYEKAVNAMILAGKAYYDGVAKIGEIASGSPVSTELGELTVRYIYTQLECGSGAFVLRALMRTYKVARIQNGKEG
ncbi:hypothetical protein EI555_019632, partial [Monodon monoceros]